MIPPAGKKAVGALWYKEILQTSTCPPGSSPYVKKPNGFSTGADTLNWAVVLPQGPPARVVLTSAGKVLQSTLIYPGLNFGAPGVLRAGKQQQLDLYNTAGELIMTARDGKPVNQVCPRGTYNMNPVVVGLATYGGSNI
jgi:glucan endo-1,3-alpha-glucosidase